MKIKVVLLSLAGIMALALTAFISNTSFSGDKQLLNEFQGLFPKKDFPLVIDSTFLMSVSQKEKLIENSKFKSLVPDINPGRHFTRMPVINSFYAVTRVKETGKYSVFAYIKHQGVTQTKWQGYFLYLVSLSNKGEQISNKFITVYQKSDRNSAINNDIYKEITFNTDGTISQSGEGSVFSFTEKGEIIEKSGDGIVKK
jgi:hypothetical protein